MARLFSLFAVLACIALIVVPDATEAGRRRRRRRDRGLKNGGDVFSWRCAGEDLNRYLNEEISLNIVSQACAKNGKKNLACFMVSSEFPEVPIAVDVKCNKRRGWVYARAAGIPTTVNTRDVSSAEVTISGINAADVDEDELKQLIVDELGHRREQRLYD